MKKTGKSVLEFYSACKWAVGLVLQKWFNFVFDWKIEVSRFQCYSLIFESKAANDLRLSIVFHIFECFLKIQWVQGINCIPFDYKMTTKKWYLIHVQNLNRSSFTSVPLSRISKVLPKNYFKRKGAKSRSS